jgi:hypothetical protein
MKQHVSIYGEAGMLHTFLPADCVVHEIKADLGQRRLSLQVERGGEQYLIQWTCEPGRAPVLEPPIALRPDAPPFIRAEEMERTLV